MVLFQSVSFWIILFSALIGFTIGSFTHWIVGLIFFLLLAGKTAVIGLVLDTISGSLKYHHDRQDIRARKSIASIMFFKASRNNLRQSNNLRLKKL